MDNVIQFAFSKQGYNHIKNNKVCQDASKSFTNDDMSVVVVADGHGGDNYPRSDMGSYFAAEVAIDSVKEFVDAIISESILLSEENYEEYLAGLTRNILSRWYSAINDYTSQNPISKKELEKVSDKYKNLYQAGEKIEKAYGTTLIVACVTKDFWFGFQIGDGKCVAFDKKGNVSEPIPWDEQCQNNITTSICDSDAGDEFRFYFSNELPVAVFLGCDGIDDSYPQDDDLYSFYGVIPIGFYQSGEKQAKKDIEEYLPELSKRGSGDDVSIAGLIMTDTPESVFESIRINRELITARGRLYEAANARKSLQEKISQLEKQLENSRKSIAEIERKLEDCAEEMTRRESAESEAAQKVTELFNKINKVSDNEPYFVKKRAEEVSECDTEEQDTTDNVIDPEVTENNGEEIPATENRND